jgi:5'-nucleotidase
MEESQIKPRREFLKKISAGAVAAGSNMLFSPAFAERGYTRITILHTNDVHSHIDPFEENHPDYPGMGGVARRSALIKKIRSTERNVLLLDAGDIFQGTPYFNLYGGELEMKLMSKMGYDAATIGNHDFDNGIDQLADKSRFANFPLINCNYDFSETSMKNKTIPYKIFNKEGIRIGIIGIGIELAGLVNKRLYNNTKYIDPLCKAMEYSAYLKKQKKCDLIICLSHLGYSYKNNKISDLTLAEKSENIDLIIGGHTHTFLPEPVKTKNKNGKDILVTQAGWAGLRLGRIDYYFEQKTGRKISYTSTIEVLKKSSEI